MVFGLDHINYAHWIPVHSQDMKSLSNEVKRDLKKYWVFKKTQNKFSCMPIDQGHNKTMN